MNLSNLMPNLFKNTQSTVTARPLHCVFYSHIWTVYSLEELGLVNAKTDIIVELATQSNFAPALNPAKEVVKNLVDLVQPEKHLHQLAHTFKNISAPMLLAPSAPVPFNALLSSLALVKTDVSSFTKAVVLVHINDAPQFTLAYSQMDYFSIAWDIADNPSANLVSLAELLVQEDCLSIEKWRGMQLCQHKQRQLSDSDERKAILNQLMNNFPFVKAV